MSDQTAPDFSSWIFVWTGPDRFFLSQIFSQTGPDFLSWIFYRTGPGRIFCPGFCPGPDRTGFFVPDLFFGPDRTGPDRIIPEICWQSAARSRRMLVVSRSKWRNVGCEPIEVEKCRLGGARGRKVLATSCSKLKHVGCQSLLRGSLLRGYIIYM